MGERTGRQAHRCGGKEGMSVSPRKFNREEWVTEVICLGLRGMRCLGEDVGPRAGLPETWKGRGSHFNTGLGPGLSWTQGQCNKRQLGGLAMAFCLEWTVETSV